MVYDFRTPEHMWQAIFDNKKKAEGYTDSLGTAGARSAVAAYAKRMGAPNVSQEDVITFVGGSEAILYSMQALFNQGENCLIPNPGYSIFTGELSFLECEANEYYLDEENKWSPDVDHIEKKINPKTRAIVVINPNNPTGAVYSKSSLQKIIDVAGANDLLVYADETYDQLLFDKEKFVSMASIAKDVPVISLGSISKNYLAPVAPVQYAMEAALNGPQGHIKETVAKLEKRRDFTYKRLNEIEGLSCVKPKGAFYAYPKLEFELKSDREFVIELLKETGVLVVYGEGFGQKPGTHHFRVVFLPPEQTLAEAYDKIEKFIKQKYLK